jgi:hypothetical protein
MEWNGRLDFFRAESNSQSASLSLSLSDAHIAIFFSSIIKLLYIICVRVYLWRLGTTGMLGTGLVRTNGKHFGTWEREREIDPIIIDFTINAIRKNSFFCLFYTIVSFEGGECAETMMRNNNKMSYSV